MASLTLVSPAGDEACFVSSDGRIRVHSTLNSAAAPRLFREKAHLASAITAGAWAPVNDTGAPPRVALGRDDGVVVVWDTLRGEVLHRLGATGASARHSSPVRGIAWSADGDTLFSSAEGSPLVLSWNARTGASFRSFTAEKRGGVSAVAASPDGGGLFVAHSDIHIVSTESGKRSRRLQGHSLPVRSLSWWPGDDSTLVTCSDESHVCVWDSGAAPAPSATPSGTPTVAPSAVLLNPCRPLGASVVRLPKRKRVYHVAVAGEDGRAAIWRYKRAANTGDDVREPAAAAGAPVLPSAAIRVVAPGGEPGEKHGYSVLAVKLLRGGAAAAGDDASASAPVSAMVVVGPHAAPSFFHVAYTDSEGHIDPEGVTLRVLPQRAAANGTASAKRSRPAAAEDDVETDGATAGHSSSSAGGVRARSVVDALTDGGEHIAGHASGVVPSARARSAVTAPSSTAHAAAAAAASSSAGAPSAASSLLGAAAGADAAEGVGDDGDAPTLAQALGNVIAALRGDAHLLRGQQANGAGAVSSASGGVSATPPSTSASSSSSSAPLTAVAALATTGSLAVVVAQALAAGDDFSLEQALGYSDARVIRLTVERLPSPSALAFLARLVEKLRVKSVRAKELSVWIAALLEVHAAHLMTIPDTAARLLPLRAVLEPRTAAHPKLTGLAGRLKLLLGCARAASGEEGGGGAASSSYERTLKRARRTVVAAALEAEAAAAATAAAEEEAAAPTVGSRTASRRGGAAAEEADDDGDAAEAAALDEDAGGDDPSENGSDGHLDEEDDDDEEGYDDEEEDDEGKDDDDDDGDDDDGEGDDE